MDAREELVMIGERIRNARKRRKLSQTAFGRTIGYSMNGIAKIERGESDPKLSSLVKIAGALDMDVGELVSGQTLYLRLRALPSESLAEVAVTIRNLVAARQSMGGP